VYEAVELEEPVLDRSTGEGDPEVRVERVRRARGLAARVLDRLRLVEDHAREPRLLELVDVAPQRAVRGEDDVDAGLDRAIDAVVPRHREARTESARSRAPS